MKRLLLVMAFVVALPATAAVAADFSDDGNSQVTVETPALVSGEVWADSRGVYLISTRDRQCWYPQDWYDDVVIVDDAGEFVGYNEDSLHYNYVVDLLNADPARFAEIDLFSNNSCIQNSFLTRGDCSTEDRIAVLSTYAVRDYHRGVTLSVGDFDFHERAGLYCLVVIERDPWLELVRDESLVPEPVRATYPQFRTLVGLDNSVWYDVAAGVDGTNGGFSVGIPTQGVDYNLTLQIWLTGIEIDIDGDGVWEYTQSCTGTGVGDLESCAGSEEDPVYAFEYETRAFHPFTIRALWAGQAVDETGQLLDIAPGLLLNEFTFDWETVEVRSSLD